MRRILFSVFVSLLLFVSALAHEFWIQPAAFFVKAGTAVSLNILVGENFNGERWEARKSRIARYRHFSATGETDLMSEVQTEAMPNQTLRLTSAGTHLVALANTNKFIELDRDKFLAYLREDGLDNAIAARKQRGETGKKGREHYRRCVKTLIQAGDTRDQTFAQNAGMPLEIMPLQNPYAQRPGQMAEFEILFEQKPLAGALVRYWNRSSRGLLTVEKQRSDSRGRVRFRLRAGGNMVSLVNMVPYEKTSEADPEPADWQSYWGSLTFGCR